MITTKATISYKNQIVPPLVNAVQGDTGRNILFTISDYEIPAGATATFYIQKPSKEAVYNTAVIDASNNTVEIELTAQCLAEYGENFGQIRIMLDGEVITSFDFILLVKAFRGIDAIESTSESNIFDQAVEAAAEQFQTEAEAIVDEVIESIPEDYSTLSQDVTDLKADLSHGNFNQRVKTNPFVIAASSINREIGAVMGNRSVLEVISTGIKATRNATNPTYRTFGFAVYMDKFDPGNSGHKIYVSISNLALSGSATLSAWRIFGSHRGTTQGIANTDFTESNYKKILTLTADVAEFNIVAVTDQPASTTDYFTLESVQIIDLTQMFGSGYEPTVEEFEAVYSDTPYPFRVPVVQTDTRETKVLINREISKKEVDYEIINNISDMISATKDKVLVLHNDSQYGDGGPCWFEYLSYATENGYARADGGKMYPMLNQGALLPSAPPARDIMAVISSYLENSDLVYGQTGTLFDTTATTNIDCSSFVNAVLHGISYFTSKYVSSGNKSICKVCSYNPNPSFVFGYASSRQMAQYFAEQKVLYKMPTSEAMRRILSVGDILFTGSGLEACENRFLKIDHVFIVLALLDNDRVVIAQCGSCPSAMTERNNSSTVGKVSTIILSNENIGTYCKAFARPSYINAFNSDCTGAELKPLLIPNVYVNTAGTVSSSGVASATPGLIEVVPESIISFTGTKEKDDISYFALVTEYDAELQFISRTYFTNNDITLGATTKYIRITYGHNDAADGAMTLKETNLFGATLTNH